VHRDSAAADAVALCAHTRPKACRRALLPPPRRRAWLYRPCGGSLSGHPPARLVTVGCALRARRLTAEECVDVLTSVARLKPPLTEKSYAMLKRLCDAVEAIIDECLPPQLSHIAWALAVLQARRLRARTSNAILPCAFSEAHGSIDAHLQPMPAAGCPRLYRYCVCSPLPSGL
jgi:hypothetical protein